ncbi:potassium channel subfamily K member 17 [Eucyclogobius newberryi]|uniref:potassium channel subfamily K member 17 n=1 Tax=Eucyclogobius newberryi TaxID=166745 RepID=UPI003B5CF725
MGYKEILNLARVPSILLLGVIYMTYVLIGGVVFWTLEGKDGEMKIQRVIQDQQQVLNKYSCLNHDNLQEIIQLIQDASKAGVSLKSNDTKDGFWKFTTSAVFAATVVTTIGYGNISPSTIGGQIFCVFFALFGIPLNVVVLNRVGKYMLAIERNISDFLEEKMDKKGKKLCMRFSIHFISYLTGVILFFVVPMFVFQEREGWTYPESLYFCFISLSTIGFGDYVADNNPERYYPDWYNILGATWIFFGLAWLALVINHVIENLERLNNYMKGWWGDKKAKDNAANGEEDNPETQVEEEYDKTSEQK